MNDQYRISIGNENRDILIGDGNISIRTHDISVAEGGSLTILAGGSQYYLEPTEPPVQPAERDELLILIAQFDGYGAPRFKVEERIRESLEREFGSEGPVRIARLRNVTVQDGDHEKARRVGTLCRASMVIWGWYDAVGFRPCFTVVEPRGIDGQIPDFGEVMIESANHEFSQYVFKGLQEEMTELALFVAGQLFYWGFRLDEAVALFEQVISRKNSPAPILTSSWFYRGVIKGIHKGDVAGAVESFGKAVAIDPSLVAGWYNLGDAHYFLGELEAAILAHSRVLALEPKHLYALLERGDARARLGRYAEAIEDYTRALNIQPWTRTYLARGRTFELWGLSKYAIADYECAQSLDPYCTTASDRLNAYPLLGEGKQMSREGSNFDRRDFTRYYETALRVLGRPNPPLGTRSRPEDKEASQLAEAMTSLLSDTGLYGERCHDEEEIVLYEAGKTFVSELVSQTPNMQRLIGSLPPLMHLKASWPEKGQSAFWKLIRLPVVRNKFGEQFFQLAEFLDSNGGDYITAAHILGRDPLACDPNGGLTIWTDVQELATLLRALLRACKRADAKRFDRVEHRRFVLLTSASGRFIEWVLDTDGDFKFNSTFSDLLEIDGKVRNAFLLLAGNPAVERRIGEKRARILRLICSYGSTYLGCLSILGKDDIEKLPADQIKEDVEAVKLSRLISAVRRTDKESYSDKFLNSVEQYRGRSDIFWVVDAYKGLEERLKSPSKWVTQMNKLLAFPQITGLIRGRPVGKRRIKNNIATGRSATGLLNPSSSQ